MYKAQSGGLGLQDRKKAKLITVMAVVILSIFILVGCSNPSGGPGDPPAPTVTEVTVNGAIVVVKGGSNVTEQYTAIVTGTNDPSQAVTWSIESGASDEVSISSTGLLTVTPMAATGNITIKATSTVAGYTNISGTKVVTINDSTDPTVTGVTIAGATSVTKNVSSNVYESYTATVTGDNSPSQTVTWSIDGNPTGVSIPAGVLTVESTAATGDITIRATSTVAGYTNISGTKSVTINAPLPNTATPANFLMEYEKLGLDPGTYTAGSLISAMDARATAATVTDPGDGNIFYNPSTSGISGTFSHVNWPGGATTYGSILSIDPGMRWIVNGDNLVYYGQGTAFGITITFNVAVIRISDGYGWIYGPDIDYATNPDLENVVKETYENVSDVRTISISDLTNGIVSDVTGLGNGITTGYKVYIIVRMTNSYPAVGDFNTVVKSSKVIAVHPEPTYTTP
jgi:hypothetical protein